VSATLHTSRYSSPDFLGAAGSSSGERSAVYQRWPQRVEQLLHDHDVLERRVWVLFLV